MAALTIKDWNLGIGDSVYTGFGQMVNVDIYSKPGCLKISNRLERDEESIPVVDNLIKWAVQDPQNNDCYLVDDNGKLYLRDAGGNWTVITGHGATGAGGQGLAIWKDYLFYARATRLDVYGPLSGSPSWENDWQTLESVGGSGYHPMMAAQDDYLYIGNAQFVDTVNEVFGQTFDPTNALTYTYNAEDLELRSDYRIRCLDEQGSYIVIGTTMGINAVFNVADIFVWDGTSDSFQLNGTIHLVENGVMMMKNVGNILNVIAGTGVPRVFHATTSQSVEAKRFNNIEMRISQRLNLYPGAMDLQDGEVLFGIGRNSPLPYMGVYSMRNQAYVLRYLISTFRDGSTDGLQIGVVKSISANRLLVAWRDEDEPGEYGVDVTSNYFYYDYSAYVESPLYTVGTEADPTTYEKVEVRMGKKLQTGDGVKIYIRTALDDTWTPVATFDTPTYTGRYVFEAKVANVSKMVDMQVRVELTTDDTSEESPELKEIVFS